VVRQHRLEGFVLGDRHGVCSSSLPLQEPAALSNSISSLY
jgi:hypothetical protein